MICHINLPGSSHFRWSRQPTRALCEAWLEKTAEKMMATDYALEATLPRIVSTEKEAANCRYLDGTRIFPKENPPSFWGDSTLDSQSVGERGVW